MESPCFYRGAMPHPAPQMATPQVPHLTLGMMHVVPQAMRHILLPLTTEWRETRRTRCPESGFKKELKITKHDKTEYIMWL